MLIRRHENIAERSAMVEHWTMKAAEADVVVFDLDGTLIDSDYANFLSYKSAIQKIMRSELQLTFEPNRRVTREIIKDIFPEICDEKLSKIIKRKECIYKMYLCRTTVNNEMVKILEKSQGKKIILATNSSKERAELLLSYHKLSEKFTLKYYKEDINKRNKYLRIFEEIDLAKEKVVVFEDNKIFIESAIAAGACDKFVFMV